MKLVWTFVVGLQKISISRNMPDDIRKNYTRASYKAKDDMRYIWNTTGKLDHIRSEKVRREA